MVKVKTNSVAAQVKAKIREGWRIPIAQNSKVKSKAVNCVPNASGQSAWIELENGMRVCVYYKNWTPFLWTAPPIKTKGGSLVYTEISRDQEVAPHLPVHRG